MALPRTFDPIFARYAGALPVNYLRALAKRESNLNPQSGGGTYWGLLQVGYTNVLPSYNKRRGTSYTKEDLFDAEINVKIAADLLNRIVKAYAKHPDPNMRANWHNPEFVALVTAGWNSGYSEAAGVGHVASYLEGRGIPVTHANVFKYAGAAGGTKHLQNPKKQAWQQTVVRLFYEEGGPGGMGPLGKLILTVAAAWAVYHYLLK
jgi:hypothetical protein